MSSSLRAKEEFMGLCRRGEFQAGDRLPSEMKMAERFGIMTRVGLHCAPSAHRTLGTFPAGTIRFSFGPENTEAEVDLALEALEQASRPRD